MYALETQKRFNVCVNLKNNSGGNWYVYEKNPCDPHGAGSSRGSDDRMRQFRHAVRYKRIHHNVAQQLTLGMKKAVLNAGHFNLEEPGMEHMAD